MQRFIRTTVAAVLLALGMPGRADAPAPPAEALEPGATLRIYDIGREMLRLLPLVPGQTPNVDVKVRALDFGPGDFPGFTDRFVAEIDAWFEAPAAGDYAFRLECDDGARVFVNGDVVVEDDFRHAMRPVDGTVTLDAGWHRLRVAYFEDRFDEGLRLSWRPPGDEAFAVLDDAVLRTPASVTRVVAPGPKRVLGLPSAYPTEPSPGDRLPLETVHPGFVVEDLRPEGFEPQVGALAFLPDGRLVVADFRPQNSGNFLHAQDAKLWVLDGVLDRDPAATTATLLDENLKAPMGMTVVDGTLYVADADAVYRYTDPDGDGLPQERSVLAAGWSRHNYHQFTMGLEHRDGYLYTALSTSINSETPILEGEVVGLNGPNAAYRGAVLKIALDTGVTTYLAGGFRTPNGMGFTAGGDLIVTDNQGSWRPANRLDVVHAGAFYGHHNDTDLKTEGFPRGGVPSLFSDKPPVPPAVWLPHNDVSNSPANVLPIPDADGEADWAGPMAGQLLLAEFTAGGLRRVQLDRTDGVDQGAVFRLSQGFEVGLNRMIPGPDGNYYVGGTGSGGNWNWRGTMFGLQRLRPVAGFTDTFEIARVEPTATGMRLRFTRPVDADVLSDPANYRVRHWTYTATAEYGGEPQQMDELKIAVVEPGDDGTSVHLTLPGRRPGFVVHLWAGVTDTGGEGLWSPEAWYTLHTWPGRE